jgi:DNA-binding LacI/PurR family transcriptional regulator
LKNKSDLTRASLAEPSGKKVSISRIAEVVRVSPSLVSAFLSGKDYSGKGKPGIRISKETAQRIVQVCRELGFVPERPAVCNRIYPELGDIIFTINRQTTAFRDHRVYSLLIDGILAGARENEILVNLSQYEPDVDYEREPEKIPHNIISGDITKVIVGGGRPNYSFIKSLLERGCSVAYVMRDPDIPGVTAVLPDHYDAGLMAVNHLIQKGHRRIVFAAYDYMRDSFIGIERCKGIVDGLKLAGLPWREEDIVYLDSAAAPNQTQHVLRQFMDRSQPPTAMCCFYDRIAEHFMHAARSMGIRIPDDLSLIGCNDDGLAASLKPELSTIHIPAFEIGVAACKALNGSLPASQYPSSAVTLPVHLVERHSVAQLDSSAPAV